MATIVCKLWLAAEWARFSCNDWEKKFFLQYKQELYIFKETVWGSVNMTWNDLLRVQVDIAVRSSFSSAKKAI